MKVGLCRQTIQVASRVVLINDADQVLTIAVAEMLSVPPIIISGEHEKEVVVECLTLGAAGYVVKPYTRQTLLGKINKALMGDQ